MRTNELMLYKNMEYGEILKDITFLIDNYESEFYNKEDLRGLLFDCINELLELSVSHGFEGNLWHTYLTFLLASDENAYSTSCEIVGEIEGSLNEIALHDFAIFKDKISSFAVSTASCVPSVQKSASDVIPTRFSFIPP